ncbi:MAG: MFS transporter [Nostocoides sp.]
MTSSRPDPARPTIASDAAPRPDRARALLATASVAVALAAADTYVVVLALTDMMSGVGVGVDSLQKATPIISGFLLGYVAVLPLIGRLTDLVPRQRVLLICLGVFVLGSAITALAADLPTLVTGRVIQGVGGGGLVPATLALVADLWPADRRGTPLGVVGAVQELGSVLGPVLGAAILAIADWRAIFWVNAVLGVLLWLLIRLAGGRPATRDGSAEVSRGQDGPAGAGGIQRVVGSRRAAAAAGALGLVCGALALAAPARLVDSVALGAPFIPFGDHTNRVLTPIGLVAVVLLLLAVAVTASQWWAVLRRADLLGAVLLGSALGLVILTFASANPEKEIVGPVGFALLPLAVVAAGLYLWRHHTADDPLVPRGVVQGRSRVALLVSVFVGVALVAIVVDVPLLARLGVNHDETAAAFVLVRFLLAVPVGALAGGWLLRRSGDGLVAGGGLAVTALGLASMARWDQTSLTRWPATVVLVAVGLGIGLALAPVNNAALADAPADAHGTASALVVVARTIGMVVGLAFLTAIGLHKYYEAVAALANPADTAALVEAAVQQVRWVFGGAAVAAGLGAVSCLGLGLRRQTGTYAAKRTFGL